MEVARYKPLLDNLAALGVKYGNSSWFQTPEQAARKLVDIIEQNVQATSINFPRTPASSTGSLRNSCLGGSRLR